MQYVNISQQFYNNLPGIEGWLLSDVAFSGLPSIELEIAPGDTPCIPIPNDPEVNEALSDATGLVPGEVWSNGMGIGPPSAAVPPPEGPFSIPNPAAPDPELPELPSGPALPPTPLPLLVVPALMPVIKLREGPVTPLTEVTPKPLPPTPLPYDGPCPPPPAGST